MILRRDTFASTTTRTTECGLTRWSLRALGEPSANVARATGRGAVSRRVDFVAAEG